MCWPVDAGPVLYTSWLITLLTVERTSWQNVKHMFTDLGIDIPHSDRFVLASGDQIKRLIGGKLGRPVQAMYVIIVTSQSEKYLWEVLFEADHKYGSSFVTENLKIVNMNNISISLRILHCMPWIVLIKMYIPSSNSFSLMRTTLQGKNSWSDELTMLHRFGMP